MEWEIVRSSAVNRYVFPAHHSGGQNAVIVAQLAFGSHIFLLEVLLRLVSPCAQARNIRATIRQYYLPIVDRVSSRRHSIRRKSE